MKVYTLGFMFSTDRSQVLLILKDRPEWQAGKLNGIGGKYEPDKDHTFKEAHIREFEEETGIKTIEEDWELFCIIKGVETIDKIGTIYGSNYEIRCFRAFSNDAYNAKQMESEVPVLIETKDIADGVFTVLPNVNWLIPMALHHTESVLQIQYND